jgi:hypothetical protein
MKKILPVILFLLMAASCFATDIEGTWVAKMQGPDSDMELTFVFKMVGEKLTGTMQSPNGDIEITNTTINGKEFSFDISFNDMTIKHKCTLKEDGTISMKTVGSPMGGDSEMILKRKP